ncbi:MAG: hypothetical protein ACRC4O_10925 [Giesbergeria sp.]
MAPAHDWQRMPLRPGEVVRWSADDICEAWDGSKVAYLDEQERRWWWAVGREHWLECETREAALAQASRWLRRLGYVVEGG